MNPQVQVRGDKFPWDGRVAIEIHTPVWVAYETTKRLETEHKAFKEVITSKDTIAFSNP